MHQVISPQADISAVRRFIRTANTLIEEGSVEDVIRQHMVSHFRGMFPAAPSWIDQHIAGGEVSLKYNKDKRLKPAIGFVDNLVGLTVIEYEKDLRIKKFAVEGLRQVHEYCAGLLNENHRPDQIIGVLSDSVRWHSYKIISVASTPGLISGSDVVLEEMDSVDASGATDIDAQKLGQFLTKNLQRLESRPLNAVFIGRDLGFTSEFCAVRLSGITAVIDAAFSERPAYAALITKLWVNFVSYVRAKDTSGFDKADYGRELYILTLGKLICANALLRRASISNDEELSDILDGSFFQRYGLLNFVEYDYFGWLNSEKTYRDRILPLARAMQGDLQAYDFTRPIEEDLFGTLMSQLASKSLRLLLGQEWTPSWLSGKMVTEVLSRLGEGTLPRFIDMCSGSGSMLVEVVKQSKAKILATMPKDSSLQDRASQLAKTITGFDIDPLAVMLSKISWVLTARDWLGEPGTVQITIPVYHADTLFAMTPISTVIRESRDFITLQMEEYNVEMPRFLVSTKWQPMFDSIIEKAYEMSHSGGSDILSGQEFLSLTGDIARNCGVEGELLEMPQVAEFLKDLTAAIYELTTDRRNGIWSFVIKNSYRPGLVAGQFNGLVSNPPWLTLSKTSASPYEKSAKDLAALLGIRPSGASAHHVELSVLFLLHAILHYLTPDAIVGCVLPATILNGDHLKQFRTGAYKTAPTPVPFQVNELWQVQPGTFKNQAAVVFGTKRIEDDSEKKTYPLRLVSANAVDVKAALNVSKQGKMVSWARAEGTTVLGSYDPGNFRQGADVMPRTLFFHETMEAGPGLVSLRRLRPTSESFFLIAQPKDCENFSIPTPCVLPDDLIQYVFTSNLLVPFVLGDPEPALLPIKRDTDGKWVAIESSDFLKSVHPAWKKARSIFDLLGSLLPRANSDRAIGTASERIFAHINTNRKKLSNQERLPATGHIVVFGAGGTNLCAASVPLDGKNELVERLIFDQTLYWHHVTTENEALYLTGALNTDMVNERIKLFQPKGLANERHIHKLALAITPPYNPEDASHIAMVERTRFLMVDLMICFSELKSNVQNGKTLDSLLDPNRGLASRRQKVKALCATLPSYAAYQAAGRILYTI